LRPPRFTRRPRRLLELRDDLSEALVERLVRQLAERELLAEQEHRGLLADELVFGLVGRRRAEPSWRSGLPLPPDRPVRYQAVAGAERLDRPVQVRPGSHPAEDALGSDAAFQHAALRQLADDRIQRLE